MPWPNNGTTIVRLGEYACPRDRDVADAQCCPASVRKRCGLTLFFALLQLAKVQAGWNELYHRASALEMHSLRAARRVVCNRQCPSSCSGLRGFEAYVDRATCASRDARTTTVRLAEITARGNARDAKRHCAVVCQLDAFRRAGSVHKLRDKGQSGGCQSGVRSGGHAGATQSNRLRAAGSIVGDRDRGNSRPNLRGPKGHGDIALRPRIERRTARVGLGIIGRIRSRNRNAANAQP